MAPVLEFKPTFHVVATKISKSADPSKTFDVGTLDAAGPALTVQSSHQNPDGQNYADYSASIVLLLSGNSGQSPEFVPAVALTAGFFNNIVELGGGYQISSQIAQPQKWFFLVSIGINLFNN
jgi:hypothetical protein